MSFNSNLAGIAVAGWLCVAAPAQKPNPAPEMKELLSLVGTWATNETIEPNPGLPSGATYAGTVTVTPGPGGFSVILDHHSKGAPGTYAGNGMIAWHPSETVYRMAWADSTGPGITFATGSKEGSSMVFRNGPIREVIDITPDLFTLTAYRNDGSGEKKTITIKYTRKQ